MNWKLVWENRTQRFYESDELITKVPNKLFDFKEEWEIFLPRIKTKYKSLTSYENGTNLICVSDATTHIERLVFAAIKIINTETNEEFYTRASSLHIDGKNTFMVDGGDSKSVYNDKVYLRHLSMLNSKG